VSKCSHREYGPADIIINKFGNGAVDALFEDFGGEMRVRISPYVMTRDPHLQFRYGCPTEINFQNLRLTSMSSGTRSRHHMLL